MKNTSRQISKFSPGQLVIVDGKWQGEILHNVYDNGYWRVEVDCDREKHEGWTVHEDRMEVVA